MKIVAVGLVLLLAIAANVMSEINQPQCIEKEKEALLSLKLSLHDPGNLLSSWSNNGTNQNCCDWSFITCDDQTNHVIAFNLTNYDHRANPVGGELGSSLVELQYLSYLNLYGMNFTRIPKSIGSLTDLTYLGLGENPIDGIIPPQLGNLSKLQVLDLSSSSQMVVDNLEWLSHCTSLMTIFISNCLLPKVDTSSLSYTNNSFLFLKSLQLSENSIHPSTITWLLNSSINLEKLVLTNNVIEVTFPNSFGQIKSLEYVDLSGNELGIMGVPNSLSNLTKLKYLDLSHNNLKGTLHDLLENLFGPTKSSLEILDFSHNLLSGSIPANYWGNFQFLIVLNLAHNMLSGEIPSSISMPILQTLQLSHNNLSGTLPSSLKTCGFLRILDLGSNNLTGPIPPWIGEIPRILVLLSLKSNNFDGSIPLNLCNISTMQILDLSSNDLSGSIPSCIKNFKAMVEDYYDPKTTIPSIPVVTTTPGVGFDDSYINTASIIWKGTQYEYDKNLGLLRIIDLSNNKLNGEIPIEVSYLSQLRLLNLSCNNFTGRIPRNIGNLNKLELLDLSRNKVFGEIPTSLAEISSLNYLDLSNNRLSGRIPTGTQLQTFDPSRYTMNFGLCGPPISRSCPGDEPYVPQSPANDSDQGAHDEDDGEWINLLWFYIGIGIGFTIGFCGVFGSLVINTSWRHAYFRFMHYLSDWLYVMINVKWALLWRKLSWHQLSWR